MLWQVPKIWDGGEVWILGGGPSVTKEFNIPEKVVKDVGKGILPVSVYSPYLSSIHNKHIIGINVAFLIGDWIDIVFFGDTSFLLPNKEKLAMFPGLKVSCTPHAEKYSWVKYVARDPDHPHGLSPNPKMVGWNANSGAAAISLAIHLGAKRIILLGFDMNLDEKNHMHWHNLYGKNEVLENGVNRRKLPFVRHLTGFPVIARDAKRIGVTIINASPTSAINDFPKVSVKDLICEGVLV
jgi:hypothetical protein